MMAEFKLGYLIILSIVSVIGSLTCTFIVGVIFLDWAKARRLNTNDYILLPMETSHLFFQWFLLAGTFIAMKLDEICDLRYTFLACFQLEMWSTISSTWFIATLSVFYCVKIVDFHHTLITWLKLRISKMVTWLILVSVVGSLVLSIPVYWRLFSYFSQNSTDHLGANSTAGRCELIVIESHVLVVNIFGFFMPFSLGMASITLILISLRRHTQRMKVNASEFSKPRLDAHIGAARLVASLLLIYICTLLTQVMKLILDLHLMDLVASFIFASSIPAQSITLILGNTKLKQVLWKVLSPQRNKKVCTVE